MLLNRGKHETSLQHKEAGNNWLDSNSEKNDQGAEVHHKQSVSPQHYAVIKKGKLYIRRYKNIACKAEHFLVHILLRKSDQALTTWDNPKESKENSVFPTYQCSLGKRK